MKLGLVLHELHHSENDLAQELLHASERHKVDHSIYHLGQDLAEWSRQHVREIAEIAGDYGQKLDHEPKSELATARRLRERGSEMLGRKGFPELALLHDLREIYTKACGVSADWEMLAQAAQGIQHLDLLAVVQRCHPDTLRQMKWANAAIKENSTQILVS
ncbi:hypothetical protein GCM10010977_21060 [Citricoccus zhacaiensis]|uniref:DUF892 family protein n=1 Tax=Citricoccus zhacaiensis TaxID=489142 RepID=A0ABQ2M2F8_9MICC|nr:hypothetical protein [Citricoccus zhacaiensis]GGO46334.1 hypothetical protein GCM10010977_21060 [Citricoccus zhacaiensis]